MSDTEWYLEAEKAQQQIARMLASLAPESQYGPPTLLTTADSGETYVFPDVLYSTGNALGVIGLELYDRKDGALLNPGPYWDTGSDYVFEYDKIRFAGGRTKTFTDGPFARYAQEPEELSATVEPVIKPLSARDLIVARAVANWARQGGFQDPRPFEEKENLILWGDQRGDVGLIASLQAGDTFGGSAAYLKTPTPWRSIDTGGFVP